VEEKDRGREIRLVVERGIAREYTRI